MFECEIIKTQEPCITPLPRIIIRKVMAFLIMNKISYEVVKEEDIPESVPGIITYMGKKCYSGIWALKCNIEPQCLHDIAESLHHVDTEDIIDEKMEIDKFLIRETGEAHYLTAKYVAVN